MKKRILALITILLCLCILFCFVSCDDSTEETKESKQEATSTTTNKDNGGSDNSSNTDNSDNADIPGGEDIPHEHSYGEWKETKAATCTENGEKEQECSCGDKKTEIIPASHTEEIVQGKAATCTESGLTDGKKCTVCGETTVEQDAIDALGHSYGSDNTCTLCGEKKNQTYEKVDDNTILFGSYPQSKVSNDSLISTLNSKAGTKPTKNNSYDWTSYGYYVRGEVTNFMWYVDIENDGELYRGVYFISYRPERTTNASTEDNTWQYGNGYYINTVYWFKYEPISWTILTEEDGKAFLICDMIIDAQEYYFNEETRKENDVNIYANNYEYSTIRAWLNDSFYNTAFNEMQKEIILTVTVDNSAASTEKEPNNYACADTQDKVFLLSKKEVNTYLTETDSKKKQTTDYSRCQGAYNDTTANDCGWWRLRSPFYFKNSQSSHVDAGGRINNYNVTDTYGIVPALWIIL